jgi:superfamily II DNA or RNA helicase
LGSGYAGFTVSIGGGITMELRAYQNDAVDAVFHDWSTGVVRTAIEVGVGGGKTLVMAEVIKRTLAAKPDAKIVILAHRGELLRGAAKTARVHLGIQVGVVDGQVAPALRKKHLACQVVCINTATLGVSSKQRMNNGNRTKIVSELHRLLGNVDLVLMDECHRSNTDTALDCITELGCFSGTRLLGVTGTLFRQDNKLLTDVFENCCYRKGMLDLIAEGWLVEPKMKKALIAGMDLNKVAVGRSMNMGDFSETDLDRVMAEAGAEGVIAEFAKRHCGTRKTLVFTPTVNAAERVARAFADVGLESVVVHGSMPPKERLDALERFENGDLQFIINCMIITEGVDLPAASCIIMARPTKSKQLYIQILGRALRLSDGKEDALVIDLVGATSVNNMVSCDTVFGVQGEEGVLEAKARREYVAGVVATKAAAVHAALTPEEQAEVPLETLISGSFNLFDVELDELIEQVKKQAKESTERKERERVKTLPHFPAPGRSGSMLELDFDFLLALSSWATLPQYKNSYAAAVVDDEGKYTAFYCDSSKHYDKGRYGFICERVDSFEDMEQSVVKFTETFPGTAGAMYFKQNKLDPSHPKRKKPASAEQIKFMTNLLSRAKIKQDEVAMMKNGEMKKPNIGTVLDWLDYLLLCQDARKQCQSVREFLANE